MKLAPVDYIILAVYFAMVLGIGWMLRKKVSTSGDFLTSGRAVPVWITSLAFIAANLGAQELIGMAASGAKYGIMTAHFYWVGAIPAMVFMGLFMMPCQPPALAQDRIASGAKPATIRKNCSTSLYMALVRPPR